MELPHYVRVTKIRQRKFVEFEYSVGDSELYCDMVLPFAEYRKFCKRVKATEMPRDEVARLDLDRLKWRYGDLVGFKESL